MLTRLVIKNFKAIGEAGVDLELKPLTLLVGPNGSGKSSILEGLALFAQCANTRDQIGGSQGKIEGGLVNYPSLQEAVHKHELNRCMSWEIHTSPMQGYRYELWPDTGEARQTAIENGKSALSLRLVGDRRQRFTLKFEHPGGVLITEDPLYATRMPPGGAQQYTADFLSVLNDSLFDRAYWRGKGNECEVAATIVKELGSKMAQKVFLLGVARGEIAFAGPSGGRWVGAHGEGLLGILSSLGSPRYEPERTKVFRWADALGLAKLSTSVSPSGIVAEFVDPVLKAVNNLALAGYGSRQALAVVTELFWAPPGSLIMIEEPEISLHPEAQVKLGELFAEAIKEDKQVIATTHSHFLLLALGRVVQKGLLKRDDIAVYHVTKDAKGTKTTPVKLSKRGYPLGWPPSFAKVESDLAREWAKDLAE